MTKSRSQLIVAVGLAGRAALLAVVMTFGAARSASGWAEQDSSERLAPGSLAEAGKAPSGCDVTLTPRVPSPQRVGAVVRWTASASGCGTNPVFRFSVSTDGGTTFAMTRDYARGGSTSPRNWFDWRPMDETVQGAIDYIIRVDVQADYSSPDADMVSSTSAYEVAPAADYDDLPLVNSTRHPLVALYSAPPCRPPRTIRVQFQAGHRQPWKFTNPLPCVAHQSRNFLVAGMAPETTYWMRHVLSDGRTSQPLPFTTQAIPSDVVFPEFSVHKAIDEHTYTAFDVAWNANNRATWVQSGGRAAMPNAHNLNGTPLWYWHTPSFAPELTDPLPVRPLVGGSMFVFARDSESPSVAQNFSDTLLREFDLDGTPRWETNFFAVNARTNTGPSPFRIWGFHHDAVRMENGNTVIVAYTLRCLPSNTDGDYACPGGDGLWIGDALVVLDPWGEVLWKWNSFDPGHINPLRPPPLDYPVCTMLSGECPILNGRDYTHSNSVALLQDVHGTQLLLNSRRQNWSLKINYRDGAGSGDVVWKFGEDGCWNSEAPCFTTRDPANWFSHAHDVHMASDGTVLVFDNGNNRCDGFDSYFCPSPSRGQAWILDEVNGTAEPSLSFSFEDALSFDGMTPHTMYSDALGAAQRLPNGNWTFVAGNTKPRDCGDPSCDNPRYGYAIEVSSDAEGHPVQTFTYYHTTRLYRAFRMATLYDGPEP